MKLETTNVFLDTQTIVTQGFSFSNEAMKKLQELGRTGDLHLISTDITINEVEANINKRVQEELAPIARIKTVKRLPGVSEAIESLPTIAKAVQDFIGQFHTFLEESNTTTLEISGEIAGSVFEKYFKQEPPFGAGKKKSEFPDAFAIGTLLDHLGGEKCYVISADPDFLSACKAEENLINIQKLEELLDIHSRQQQEEVSRYAHRWIDENSKTLISALTTALEREEFSCDDSDDGLRQDYEIISHSITNASISSKNVIDTSDDHAIVSLDFDIESDVKFKYYNYEYAIYDKEDGKYYNVEKEEGEATISKEISCSFTLFLPQDENESASVDDFQIDNLDALDITDQI